MTADIIYKRISYRICIYIYCNIIPTAPNKALDAVSILSYNSPKRVLRKITCLSDTIVLHSNV